MDSAPLLLTEVLTERDLERYFHNLWHFGVGACDFRTCEYLRAKDVNPHIQRPDNRDHRQAWTFSSSLRDGGTYQFLLYAGSRPRQETNNASLAGKREQAGSAVTAKLVLPGVDLQKVIDISAPKL
jgi:hypothetical protein